MASFPTSVATLNNPSATDKQNSVSHSAQHSTANDEIEAIETALGASLVHVVKTSQLDADVTLAANSDTKVATQKAVKAYADSVAAGGGIPISYLDTDTSLAANSDQKVATQKAVKAYVGTSIAGVSTITRGTFTNSDLSTGVLTITHNKALSAPYSLTVHFFDNNAKQVFPDVTGLANTLTADFINFGTLTGTWGYAYTA